VKFSSILKLRATSLLLGVLSAVTAFLSRREDNAPSVSRMYMPPQVYYAPEYLIASGLLLVTAIILFILSFKKNTKNSVKTDKK
jgi:hypothetical protein